MPKGMMPVVEGPLEWQFIDGTVDLEAIEEVQSIWGVKLPTDLIECILLNNGGHPSKDVFDVQGDHRMFNYLLDFSGKSKSSVLRVYQGICDGLVDWVFPIANDPFGNFICLDYRTDRENPCIVFWDHEVAFDDPEEALTYVAASFTALLSMLHGRTVA